MTSAWGRAILSYPFVAIVLAVIMAVVASGSSRQGDLLGWLLWSLLWVGIAAFAAGLVVVPVLAVEMWVWSFVIDRITWLDRTWWGAVVSAVVVAAPWVLYPGGPGWGGPLLLALGIVAARIVVPSLRPCAP